VNIVRLRIRFERQQAFRHRLQVLFSLRDKKIENFVRHVAVGRQLVGIGNGWKDFGYRLPFTFTGCCAAVLVIRVLLGLRRLGGECE